MLESRMLRFTNAFSINFHSTSYMEYHYTDVYITISQELERQAMEQYKNNTGDEKRSMDQDCVDGQTCSEYGHCSPVKRHARRKSKYDASKIAI